MAHVKTAYKPPDEYNLEVQLPWIMRLRILFGSSIYMRTFVAMPFRGDKPMVKGDIQVQVLFRRWWDSFRGASKVALSKREPDIQPLRGRRVGGSS
jgi:hypothetical protein